MPMWDIRLIYPHTEAWKGLWHEDREVFRQAVGDFVKELSATGGDEG
jgi:hypothetical protein